MRRVRFPFLMRAMLALILGLGLAGAGAAHRPLESPAAMAALAEFVAAGGSLADLCHDTEGSGHGGGHAAMECPACTLQGGVLLPPVAAVVKQALVPARAADWPFSAATLRDAAPLFFPPPRGPPVPAFS